MVAGAHNILSAGNSIGSDFLEEAQELLVAVPRVAGIGDLAGGDVQGGEQRGGAVAAVVVAGALGQAGPDRQDGLGPVQGLVIRGKRSGSWCLCW